MKVHGSSHCKHQMAYARYRKKILQLESQGFLDNLDLRDAGFWMASEPSSDMAISPSLADLVVALAKVKGDNDVYVPWDRSGQLAARIIQTGVSTWVETQNPTLLSPCFVQRQVKAGHSMSQSPLPILQRWKRANSKASGARYAFLQWAFAIVPRSLATTCWDGSRKKSPVGDVLQIRHLLAQVKGRIVTVVSKALLFGTGSERQLREYLVESGLIEAVISMPAGLCTQTNIPVAIMILNTAKPSKQVRFVTADDDGYRTTGAKEKLRSST